jgi:NAD(P)-dependent dehydrogenase (short-subunit alcohol dehydrogenase family)
VVESGISVNCIAPGLGSTDFYDNMGLEMIKQANEMEAAGITITPEDIGNAVAFLVSNVSRRFLGQCLRIEGTT